MNEHPGKPINRARMQAITSCLTQSGVEPRAKPIQAAEKTIFDRAILDDLRELLGPEKIQRYVLDLAGKLADDVWPGKEERDEIMKRGHRIVSAAGQLGFSRLSGAAANLETAIRDKGKVDAALKSFNDERMAAAPFMLRLIARHGYRNDVEPIKSR